MNMQSLHLAAIAVGSGGAAWAIQKAIDLPNACAPTKLIYDNCYEVALRQLGGGVDIFDTQSWVKGSINSFSASAICSSAYGNYSDCMNYTPYITSAFLSSTIAIYSAFKLTCC